MEKCQVCDDEIMEVYYGGGKVICTKRECFDRARETYIDTGTPPSCKGGL